MSLSVGGIGGPFSTSGTSGVYGSFGIIINWIETGLEVSQQTIIIEIEHIVKATSAYLE